MNRKHASPTGGPDDDELETATDEDDEDFDDAEDEDDEELEDELRRGTLRRCEDARTSGAFTRA